MKSKGELWQEVEQALRGQPKAHDGQFLVSTSLGHAINHVRLADGFLQTTGETERSTTRKIEVEDLYFFAELAMATGCVVLTPEMISHTRNGSMCCSVLNLLPDFKYVGKPQRLYFLPKALRGEFLWPAGEVHDPLQRK